MFDRWENFPVSHLYKLSDDYARIQSDEAIQLWCGCGMNGTERRIENDVRNKKFVQENFNCN